MHPSDAVSQGGRRDGQSNLLIMVASKELPDGAISLRRRVAKDFGGESQRIG